jgi:hypothetical protein
MSKASNERVSPVASAGRVDMKLEVVVIQVSDVDRAKRCYGSLGWRLDADVVTGGDFRVVQFTPPGSGSSIIFGKNVTSAEPGSAQGLHNSQYRGLDRPGQATRTYERELTEGS